jgi:hypothetical protein
MGHIRCRKSNTEIYRNICSWEKSGGDKKSLRFSKNQADLRNLCVLTKIRRI